MTAASVLQGRRHRLARVYRPVDNLPRDNARCYHMAVILPIIGQFGLGYVQRKRR